MLIISSKVKFFLPFYTPLTPSHQGEMGDQNLPLKQLDD